MAIMRNREMEVLAKRRKYNYGIEVLRILSMLMVVMLHVLGRGGILESANYLSGQYHVAWFLEIVCYCAVDCYALISGYVMFDVDFKYTRYILTWLQVAMYSIGITLVFMFWNPQSFDTSFGVKSFFPVLGRRWWYFTAYTGVYFLIPFLNVMIKKLDKKKLISLCITLIMMFSVFSTIISRFWGDLFGTSNGYSMLWLTVLYILGASYKRCQSDIENKFRNLSKLAIIGWIVCIAITFILHNLGPYLPEEFWGKETLVNSFVSYISPTIIGCAGCMLIIFSRVKVVNDRWKKCIGSISKLSFGVYLIHVHPLVWQYIMDKRFVSLATMPVWKMFLGVVIATVIIFCACICVDAVRNKIFKILKVRENIEKLGKKITDAYD